MIKLIFIGICISFIIILSGCTGHEEEGLEPPAGAISLDFTKDSKIYTLAIIDSQNEEPYKSARINMLQTLAKYGLIQGKNLRVIYYDIKNDSYLAKEYLPQAVIQKPDVIFLNGTVISRTAYQMYLNAAGVKFVFACVSDPIGENLINGFEIPPHNNFTGVSYPVAVKSRLQFIKEVFPHVKKIALLHADMPQAHSYQKWVRELVKNEPEFSDYQIIYRVVPLITGEGSQEKMARLMIPHILELNASVDLFVAGNDQLGISEPFNRIVGKYASKPFNPLTKEAVMKGWGGVAAIYPSSESMGIQSAYMIMKLFKNVELKKIPAEQPRLNGFAFNVNKAKKFGIKIPIKFMELAGNNIIQ